MAEVRQLMICGGTGRDGLDELKVRLLDKLWSYLCLKAKETAIGHSVLKMLCNETVWIDLSLYRYISLHCKNKSEKE